MSVITPHGEIPTGEYIIRRHLSLEMEPEVGQKSRHQSTPYMFNSKKRILVYANR
jgi:hypothetical protein